MHTPGPWNYVDGHVVDTTNTLVVVDGVAYRPGYVPDDDISCGNGRLVAAAPELLEALKDIMQLIENGVLVRDISKDHETGFALHQLPLLLTLRAAQLAIAKAEGKG